MTPVALAPVVHVVVAGEIGGAERMLVSLAGARDGAARAGARPHLVALWTDAPALHDLFAGAGLAVFARAFDGPRLAPPVLRAAREADVRWLAALLRSTGAAAVHLHTFASHLVGTRAGLRAGVPVVRTEHSTRVYENWLCRPISRWSLRRTAAVIAVSDKLAALVRARAPSAAGRLRVIRNGVPLGEPAPGRAGDGPLRLALVARLEPRKGIDRALAALARVPDVQLDIVGDGPLRAGLTALASQLGVAGRVRFLGYRADPETVVRDADAVMNSSRTEGLPLGLLEGMALGRAVVASPVGGVPEIVTDGDTGWLARDMTVAALAGALRAAVAEGRAEIARRGARARLVAAERFADTHMRSAYEAVYRALNSASPPAPPPPDQLAPSPAITAASGRVAAGGAPASARIRA